MLKPSAPDAAQITSQSSVIKRLSPNSERGWRVTINDAVIDSVELLQLDHPRFGSVTYGLRPDGNDGWSFHELGGGGTVILPFTFRRNELLVGLILQARPNQGGDVWNVPRGFLDPGETHSVAARRELWEETGYGSQSGEIILLPGEEANPNSAFFETQGIDEGIRFFAVEIQSSALEERDGGLVFCENSISPDASGSRNAELIRRAQFFPWQQAATISDMFSNAAVARLLVHLRSKGLQFQ